MQEEAPRSGASLVLHAIPSSGRIHGHLLPMGEGMRDEDFSQPKKGKRNHVPLNFGARFSPKANTPSRKSSDVRRRL